MPIIIFTQQLARFVACPDVSVEASSVREALDAALSAQPRLRGYILDEAGELRRHVAVFVDGMRLRDRKSLSDRLDADSRVHVLQALSGG